MSHNCKIYAIHFCFNRNDHCNILICRGIMFIMVDVRKAAAIPPVVVNVGCQFGEVFGC